MRRYLTYVAGHWVFYKLGCMVHKMDEVYLRGQQFYYLTRTLHIKVCNDN